MSAIAPLLDYLMQEQIIRQLINHRLAVAPHSDDLVLPQNP